MGKQRQTQSLAEVSTQDLEQELASRIQAEKRRRRDREVQTLVEHCVPVGTRFILLVIDQVMQSVYFYYLLPHERPLYLQEYTADEFGGREINWDPHVMGEVVMDCSAALLQCVAGEDLTEARVYRSFKAAQAAAQQFYLEQEQAVRAERRQVGKIRLRDLELRTVR